MAHIVDFCAHARSCRASHSKRHRGQSAEIVIFPGVRYERWDDGTSPNGARNAKSRDRIDLPD